MSRNDKNSRSSPEIDAASSTPKSTPKKLEQALQDLKLQISSPPQENGKVSKDESGNASSDFNSTCTSELDSTNDASVSALSVDSGHASTVSQDVEDTDEKSSFWPPYSLVPEQEIPKEGNENWLQLSGHADGFARATPITIWKRITDDVGDAERNTYEHLSNDPEFKQFIPRYYGCTEYKGERFIEIQDLLYGFKDPHVMDIKIGYRTFLESEVKNKTLRPDLYEKMRKIDHLIPTEEEKQCKAITKLRYMQFREEISTTKSHGYRIEAMKLPNTPNISLYRKMKHHHEIIATLRQFIGKNRSIKDEIVRKLKLLYKSIQNSEYFKHHEMIGSSIFIVYEEDKVGVWLIDFAKTVRVPDGITLTHTEQWVEGNHEEGLLLGLKSLSLSFQELGNCST